MIGKKLKLKQFIDKYVERNSLVRLWYKGIENTATSHWGYQLVEPKFLLMAWEIRKTKYANNRVIELKDILVLDNYKEAVNIVIEKE